MGLSSALKGDLFEFRVQRALFWTGLFTRRRVDLKEFFAPEPLNLSDVDVFGLAHGPLLRTERLVVECKDKKGGAKEVDRILCVLGLGRHLRASRVMFAKPKIAPLVQEWAQNLGVICWDDGALSNVENRMGLSDKDWLGSHNFELMLGEVASWEKAIAEYPPLRVAFRFLKGRFWYDDNVTRCKRLAHMFQLYTGHRKRLGDDVARYILAEGLVALAACVLEGAGRWLESSPQRSSHRLEEMFASGIAPAKALRELAARIDDYYQKKLRDVAQETALTAEGKLIPVHVPRIAPTVAQAPSWFRAFASLVERTARRPFEATHARATRKSVGLLDHEAFV